MRRIRFTLLFLSIALLVAVALLVDSALRRVALESAMRHQALAERVFDEMERSLSTVLDRVERSEPDVAGEGPFPFLLGRYDIDAAGGIAARGQGRNEKRANFAEDKNVGKLVADSLAQANIPAQKPAAAPAAQMPGTTVEVGKKQKEDAGAASSASELGALRTLNKAVQERVDRQRAYAAPRGLAPSKDEAELGAEPPVLADDARAQPRGPRASLEPGPMRGRVVDAEHLLLFRTAVRDGVVFREGVLVDLAKLETWLRSQALSDILASYATLSFESPFAPASGAGDPAGAFSYRHRFAEPFAELSAHLVLRPLPGSGSATFIYALAALLLVTGVLGLAAVYRMVSVAVGFAERRSNFVAAVSHELKTPLTAIRMYGEMLRDGLVSSEAKRDEYYRHITVESERLSRLINNVLEFSRLEKGTREVALTRGSVDPVVREVADLVRPHVEEQGFELALDVDPELLAVRFDRDALMQVLWNLTDNAVKYARDGSPRRITLRCQRRGDGVALTVRDHGPGVAARHLEKIFEPFYRVENELSRRSKGTGLGLALVRGLVERMGGEVTARNAVGGGLEVEIILR